MIRNPVRGIPRRLALTAILALSAAACASPDGGGGGSAMRTGSDAEGAVLVDAVRVVKIDRSEMGTAGRVKYTVDNVSGADQEDLVWSVTFTFPPKRATGEGEIELPEESETTAERPLRILRGETGRVLDAVCGAFGERTARGQPVLGTRLNVSSNPPVLTLARTASSQGTRFANNRIECVAQSDIWASAESLTIEFENVSNAKVSDLEVQVLFTDSKARSKWKPLPSMGPGQRAKATLDIRGLDLGSRDFLVKVRQQDV